MKARDKGKKNEEKKEMKEEEQDLAHEASEFLLPHDLCFLTRLGASHGICQE